MKSLCISTGIGCVLLLSWCVAAPADDWSGSILERFGTNRGLLAVVDLPDDRPQAIIDLANYSELTIYFQSEDLAKVNQVRELADAAKLLGRKVFASQGALSQLHLASNLADGVLVATSAIGKTPDAELLRVLRPEGLALVNDRELRKPIPDGIDGWTHPFHLPDNNPQSNDQLVKGEFRTQFLADPMFSPMPEQTVIAGGRIYKAMGHIAHKANQNAMLNKLLCINAYNGTILWQRDLPTGFMIHRNTMIAMDDGLLMGTDQSCEWIDGKTGVTTHEITVPADISDGPVWKWMAKQGDTLYALVGNKEIQVDTQKSARRGLGHWPWDMWQGHEYADPKTNFGFGRTFVAIDLPSRTVKWHHRSEPFIDARGVCMNEDQLFFFCPEQMLGSLNVSDGSVAWTNNSDDLLQAIGPNLAAQHYVTGYATTTYLKCNRDYLFFAGPQRARMVVASTRDGSLQWSHEHGNLQLVLRDDGIYAAGPEATGTRLDYATGKALSELPTRRACTRATGCADSIFYRTNGGTVRVLTETNTAHHIAPMRPPCQDGVLVSNGHLYWGPWMCGCQLSLYGHIALGVADTHRPADETTRLTVAETSTPLQSLDVQPGDWVTYQGTNARDNTSSVTLPANIQHAWTAKVTQADLITAPVAAGGLVFVADRTGKLCAFNSDGERAWTAFVSGAVYYPPAIDGNRLFVGSADGYVHAFEAKTGRSLWSYRVAPYERLIPVYGRLISSWPVAGGVVVENGRVYAAAGIAHFDGTYVVALDAESGKLLAENQESGSLAPEVNGGISLQGNLSIVNGELRFLAGGVYEVARYDLETLACLNEPRQQVVSQYRTAFYPYYPEYGKYVSLEYQRADGSTLVHDASYEGSEFENLSLEAPLPAGAPRAYKEAARWGLRRGQAPTTRWRDSSDRRFTSFIVSDETLLGAGHPDAAPDQPFLVAMNNEDGTDRWIQPLPADAVKGGTAIDHRGHLFVALENGELMCFVPSSR